MRAEAILVKDYFTHTLPTIGSQNDPPVKHPVGSSSIFAYDKTHLICEMDRHRYKEGVCILVLIFLTQSCAQPFRPPRENDSCIVFIAEPCGTRFNACARRLLSVENTGEKFAAVGIKDF